jgi:hypothetical protein
MVNAAISPEMFDSQLRRFMVSSFIDFVHRLKPARHSLQFADVSHHRSKCVPWNWIEKKNWSPDWRPGWKFKALACRALTVAVRHERRAGEGSANQHLSTVQRTVSLRYGRWRQGVLVRKPAGSIARSGAIRPGYAGRELPVPGLPEGEAGRADR